MKKTLFLFGLLLFIGLSGQINAQKKKTSFNVDKNKLAVNGYDVVSYFTSDAPVLGTETYQTTYDGAIFHFANEANLKTFKKSPKKYIPQYGGYCAYGIAKGGKYAIDPLTFKITDGRLFLFYNKRGTNTLTLWNQDENQFLKAADGNWKE